MQVGLSIEHFPPSPLPNTYWVEPGRLLAGEYPVTRSRADSLHRLLVLREAGVNAFIDLTEVDELFEYQSYLPELAGRGAIVHRRFGIPDHQLPASSEVVRHALDAIDESLARGDVVYVHCRAGIGRTGTVIGCYLSRRGFLGDAALDRLAQLWARCARSRDWPSSPETDAQVEFVQRWNEGSAPAATPVARDTGRFGSALLGMAAVEAACLQNVHRNWPSGAWGADTAMTVCLAESLLAKPANDPRDQMERYLKWTREGLPAGSGVPPDVPATVKRALATWQWSRKPLAGSHDPQNYDPHSLARSVAVVLAQRQPAEQIIELAAEASRTTQQSPVALDACRMMAAFAFDILAGHSKTDVFAGRSGAMAALRSGRELKAPIAQLLTGPAARKAAASQPQDNVANVLAAALCAFEESVQFASRMRQITAATASSSAAAIYGALAGGYWGIAEIPSEPLAALRYRATLDAAAARFKR